MDRAIAKKMRRKSLWSEIGMIWEITNVGYAAWSKDPSWKNDVIVSPTVRRIEELINWNNGQNLSLYPKWKICAFWIRSESKLMRAPKLESIKIDSKSNVRLLQWKKKLLHFVGRLPNQIVYPRFQRLETRPRQFRSQAATRPQTRNDTSALGTVETFLNSGRTQWRNMVYAVVNQSREGGR